MLWAVGALAGAVGLIVLASPFWARPLIEHEASAILGRPITVAGLGLSLHSVAPLIIDFDNRDVVIGNPPGFPAGAEPFAQIQRMRVSLDVFATLRRGAFMTTVVDLQQPVVNAVATADGEKNYVFPEHHAQANEVRISDGSAHIALAPLHADLQARFATRAASGADGKPQIVGTAEGVYAALPATARFSMDVALRSGDDAPPSGVTLQVTDGQTKIAGQGMLLTPLSLRSANLTMSFSGPDMALLKPLIGATLPATPPYAVDVALDYADGLYRITGKGGRVGQSDLEGSVTVRTGGGKPADVTVDLSSREATMADLAAVLSGHAGAEAEAAAKRGSPLFSQAPLRLPQPGGGALHLTYRAQAIRDGARTLDALEVHAELANGALTVRPLDVGIGRGKLSGDFSLTPQPGGAVRADAALRLDNVGLAHLLGPTKYQEAGALNGTIRLTGTGESVAAIAGAADGGASLWMQDGDLSSLFVDLAGLRLGNALVAWLSGPHVTRVQCFIADLPLRHGIVTARSLILETADAVTQGTGTVDLARERVDLRLRTQSKHFMVGVLPGPLLISGPLADPTSEPDPSAAEPHGIARVFSMLPGVQLGDSDAPHCATLLERIRGEQAAP
jgi:uncharacterized protein involved in outer membrane biogenesis